MESKREIVENWLPRYTGTPLSEFGQYILLTNFDNYVEKFADRMGVEVRGRAPRRGAGGQAARFGAALPRRAGGRAGQARIPDPGRGPPTDSASS